MPEYLQNLIASPWVLVFVFAVAGLDALLPFAPSESTVIAVGVAAAVAAAGAYLGDRLSYAVGRRCTGLAARLRRARRGRAVHDWAHRLMHRRGGLLLVFARYVPGGRSATALAAGAVGYPVVRFHWYTALGVLVWASGAALLGYLGGAVFASNPLLGLAAALVVMLARSRPIVCGMEYRILGRLEARAGAEAIPLGGPRQQRVLAVLLLRAGRAVPIADLIEAAWDGDPPVTAEQQVRNRVAVLRSILTRRGGLIDTVDSGYRLRLDGAWLDRVAFDDLAARGRAVDDPALLREALAVWRGPALDGLGGALLEREAARLEESRLAVVEDCLAGEGERSRVPLSELRDLVAAHPVRERLVGLLMAALARGGRRDEALAAYDALAARLADELGIDPSPELRRQYQALRRPARPAQLPADVAGFVGRAADLARLDGLLSDAQAGRAAVLSAIDGTAGVGKTALAVHWGHSVRDKFPDGQLYVNLRGYSSVGPADPVEVLGGFLRALGLPGSRVPAEVSAASAMYRERLADRRVLVVLDNAADADQVRWLLPDGSGCLALVTSREALPALAGATAVTLDVLPAADAYALLAELLGAERVAAEPAAVEKVARLCAYLPLALRIAAANIGDGEPIADYAARLAGSDRLTALSIDGDERAAVRATFDLSFAGLPAAARRMFRLLGVVPGPDVTVPAAASLAAVDEQLAKVLLDRLASAHLVDEHVPGRYASHDLLRAYAIELGRAEADHPDALHRLLDHYLSGTIAAEDALANVRVDRQPAPPVTLPGVVPVDVGGREAALAWFAAELPAVVASVPRAAAAGLPLHAWWLAATQYQISSLWWLWPGYTASLHVAVEAAAHLDDWRALAFANRYLATAYSNLGELAVSERHARTVVELAERHAGHALAADGYFSLGVLSHLREDWASAVAHYREAHGFAILAGKRAVEGLSLNSLGFSLGHLGEYDEALASCEAALATFGQLGHAAGQAYTHDSIGFIHGRRGDNATAARHYREAITIFRRLDDRRYRAWALVRLGEVLTDDGDRAGGREAWQEALDLFEQMDHPDAGIVRAKLAADQSYRGRRGDPPDRAVRDRPARHR